MPAFNAPLTVQQLVEALNRYDPSALVLLNVSHNGPDGVGGIYEGSVKYSDAHRHMEQWKRKSHRLPEGHQPAVSLEPWR